MGFLLDRMALTAAAHPGILGAAARGESSPLPGELLGEGGDRDRGWASSGSADAVELEVEFLMVAFSAAVNTTPTERIRQVCACGVVFFFVRCVHMADVFSLGLQERVDRCLSRIAPQVYGCTFLLFGETWSHLKYVT